MRKTAKVDRVVKVAFAGLKSLVTACSDRERVADQNRLWHGLPEIDGDRAVSFRWSFTSTFKPALAPLVNVSLPALNQASSKLSRPLALKTEVALIPITIPFPRNRTSARSMPHLLSPRSAEQVAVNSRPLTSESRSLRPRTSAVKLPPSRLTLPTVPFARRTHKSGWLQSASHTSTAAPS